MNVVKKTIGSVVVLSLLSGMLFLSSCKSSDDASSTTDAPPTTNLPSPIPKTPDVSAVVIPADNPMSPAKVELGRHLFYDGRLGVPTGKRTDGNSFSVTSSISCASCHDPSRAFADNKAFSSGFVNQHGTRNAPTLTNVSYNTFFTWSGKFATLEKHAPGPMFSALEMGNNFSLDEKDTTGQGYGSEPGTNDTMFLFRRLRSEPKYAELFTNAWGDTTFTLDRIAKSIACFERTLLSHSSTFDDYNSGNQHAISNSAKRGFQLFIDPAKANCIACHSGFNFTNNEFRNNGIAAGETDMGRSEVTKKEADNYLFKVPSLRNVALTAPYMHDGRFSTLEEVLAHYNGGAMSTGHDAAIKPLHLGKQDISDIIEFLKTLTDHSFTSDPAFSNPWK